MHALLVHLVGVCLLGMCLLFGGCRSASEGSSPEGTWTLVELEGIDVGALARAPELTLGADGALSGFAGVNRFSGRAVPEALREGKLQTGPLASTLMAGEPRAMEAEQRFLGLLGTRLDWRRSNAELTLLEGGTVKARFRAAGAK